MESEAVSVRTPSGELRLTGPIDIEMNSLHYEVREIAPGVWAVWYHSHIIQYLSELEVKLMLAAYKQGMLAL